MKIFRVSFLFAAAFFLIVLSADADDPEPTPTPRPTTLSSYAESISLRRPESIEIDGRLTLSTDNIAKLARGGSLTEGRVVLEGRPASSTPTTAEKSRWQSRVSKQRNLIDKLALKRARIEKEIDLINDGRLTVRALALLEKAEIDLQFADQEIHRARLVLTRIIREARQHGAEPGWFR